MAKIRDESTPEGDAELIKHQSRTSTRKPGGFGDKEIGSGGARTTTDGRPIGQGTQDGYRNNR
jgi:hypothetical protein